MSSIDRESLRKLIDQWVREELNRVQGGGPKKASSDRPDKFERAVITAADIENAARGSRRIRVPKGAIITPLARDRARELEVELKEDPAS